MWTFDDFWWCYISFILRSLGGVSNDQQVFRGIVGGVPSSHRGLLCVSLNLRQSKIKQAARRHHSPSRRRSVVRAQKPRRFDPNKSSLGAFEVLPLHIHMHTQIKHSMFLHFDTAACCCYVFCFLMFSTIMATKSSYVFFVASPFLHPYHVHAKLHPISKPLQLRPLRVVNVFIS